MEAAAGASLRVEMVEFLRLLSDDLAKESILFLLIGFKALTGSPAAATDVGHYQVGLVPVRERSSQVWMGMGADGVGNWIRTAIRSLLSSAEFRHV